MSGIQQSTEHIGVVFFITGAVTEPNPSNQNDKSLIVHGRIQQTYGVVLSFLRDAAVAITPVKGHLLLLLFVQPDELLSRL